MEYRVTWTIDIEADSPVDAAQEALRIQRDKDSIATVFDVRAMQVKNVNGSTISWPRGRRTRIDLVR